MIINHRLPMSANLLKLHDAISESIDIRGVELVVGRFSQDLVKGVKSIG